MAAAAGLDPNQRLTEHDGTAQALHSAGIIAGGVGQTANRLLQPAALEIQVDIVHGSQRRIVVPDGGGMLSELGADPGPARKCSNERRIGREECAVFAVGFGVAIQKHERVPAMQCNLRIGRIERAGAVQVSQRGHGVFGHSMLERPLQKQVCAIGFAREGCC